MPLRTMCRSGEPYQYIVCNRLEDEWTQQSLCLLQISSEGLKGLLKQGCIIAVSNNCHQKRQLIPYVILKLQLKHSHSNIQLAIEIICCQSNTLTYQDKTLQLTLSILQTSIRHLVRNAYLPAYLCITLDRHIVDTIVKSSYDGMEYFREVKTMKFLVERHL